MIPHERSLVSTMQGRPFALLGVNSDDREHAKAAVQQNHMNWRSWSDGGSARGPIATEWNVAGWPTIYILDAKGVIRFKSIGRMDLETAVNELLSEME